MEEWRSGGVEEWRSGGEEMIEGETRDDRPQVGWLLEPPLNTRALREFCHFADALYLSLLKHLPKVEGGAAE